MIEKIQHLLNEAQSLTSKQEARSAAIALMRITIQHACISLVELIAYNRTLSERAQYSVDWDLLRKPSDGTIVATLAELLVSAENCGLNGISRDFWQVQVARPCMRLIDKKTVFNLENVLKSFITLRNDAVEGHGIPGNFDKEAELDAVGMTIEKLAHILPSKISTDGSLMVEINGLPPYSLKLLRSFNNDLVCYREIKKLPSGKCVVRVQVQKNLFERDDLTYESDDVFSVLSFNKPNYPEYRTLRTFDENWKPDTLFPERLTDHFTGRDREIDELIDWINDIDSRACMLFGDGGIGKTTLAIEFVHRLFEGKINTIWKPDLITFYTAKQTRWGLNGLEIIKARPVGVSDVATFIARAFEGTDLSREWFSKEPEAVIQKLGTYLSDFGYDRKKHLLILDNTETLAGNEEDVRALAKQIQELSRRVGRVLLTSRRREAIEARQVEIKPFNTEEAVCFLRTRGNSLDRMPIKQAGIPKLRQYAERLGNKPLLLEVFIQALGEPGIGLDNAFNRVLRMQQQDLGEFLYADAWNRLSPQMRHLLLLMTKVSDMHDGFLLKLCCLQVEVTVIEATEAISESRGIASVSTINNQLQIAFNPEFMKFCTERTISIDGSTLPTENSIKSVKRRYEEFLKIYTKKITDRVAKAYRHPAAKAAWIAVQEERFDDAEIFYEEAVTVDSNNGWLYDRYAYFLLSQKRLEEALDKAKRATQLISEDKETWFTRGMIEGRLGRTNEAIKSLSKARQNGKPEHLCSIQNAYAYLNDSPPNKARARNAIEVAERSLPRDQYHSRNQAEIQRIKMRLS